MIKSTNIVDHNVSSQNAKLTSQRTSQQQYYNNNQMGQGASNMMVSSANTSQDGTRSTQKVTNSNTKYQGQPSHQTSQQNQGMAMKQ